ncbi:IS3 family transposase [Klebsiella pneumoniae]|nr:IS3 family transposase [Klebsiella pneumoniae]
MAIDEYIHYYNHERALLNK